MAAKRCKKTQQSTKNERRGRTRDGMGRENDGGTVGARWVPKRDISRNREGGGAQALGGRQ
jgi:hypothetical protein